MPSQTGQLAFLGAARFQGLWNAGTNAATGSDLDGAPSGPYSNLFTAGASVNGGYHSSTNLTASAGDYWQVTGSGGHDVEGQTDWNLNDWVIFSGSAGNPGWIKLAYEDTIASIIIGYVTSSVVGSITIGGADTQIQYNETGSLAGTSSFTYNYNTSAVTITGSAEATSFFTTHAGFLNPVTFSTSVVVPDDHNGGLYGPLVFSGGNDLTIGTGSTMRIF